MPRQTSEAEDLSLVHLQGNPLYLLSGHVYPKIFHAQKGFRTVY